MKKILAVVMACILAFACMVPGVALDKSAAKSDAPPTGTVLKIGAWPQTQVTNLIICMLLKDKLDKTTPSWKNDVLPDGTSVQYADVYFEAVSNAPSTQKTYRVVQINGTYQWYRWEPLEWEAVEYRAADRKLYRAMVCTSVVTTAQNDQSAVFAWLEGEFYQAAFTNEERAEFHCIGAPLVGITNGESAGVGDYAALLGAQCDDYLELVPGTPLLVEDPHACMCTVCCPFDGSVGGAKGAAKSAGSKGAAKGAVCAPAKVILQRSREIIGVRPMLVLRSQAEEKAGGVICCILRWLFGHSH